MEKKRRYWREIYEGCSDGHRTSKCSLIWKVFSYTYGQEKQHIYEIGVGGSKVLRVSEEERVPGMSMHERTKPSGQCAEASRNAN